MHRASAAEDLLAADYRRATELLLEKIDASGYDDATEELQASITRGLRPVYLPRARELRLRLEAASFVVLDGFEKPQPSTRDTAFAHPAGRTIYLNRQAVHSASVRGLLGLHELLGLVRAPDHNYELALLLYGYARLGSEKRFRPLLDQALQRQLRLVADYGDDGADPTIDWANRRLAGGEESGTLVGNAGSETALALKKALVDHAISRGDARFLGFALSLYVEPLPRLSLPTDLVFFPAVENPLRAPDRRHLRYVGISDQMRDAEHFLGAVRSIAQLDEALLQIDANEADSQLYRCDTPGSALAFRMPAWPVLSRLDPPVYHYFRDALLLHRSLCPVPLRPSAP